MNPSELVSAAAVGQAPPTCTCCRIVMLVSAPATWTRAMNSSSVNVNVAVPLAPETVVPELAALVRT